MPAIGQQLFFLRPPLIEALIIGLLMKHQWLLVHFFFFFQYFRGQKSCCSGQNTTNFLIFHSPLNKVKSVICQSRTVIIIHFNNSLETWQSALQDMKHYNHTLYSVTFYDKPIPQHLWKSILFMAEGLCNQVYLCHWLKKSSPFQHEP